MRHKADTVERVLLTLIFVALVFLILTLLNQHDRDVVSCKTAIEFDSPVNDISLMTEKEKAWAKESHVGSFWYDGTYWIVEGMPSEYWEY